MPQYSLNNTVPEPDRSMENLGFEGRLDVHPSTKFPKGSTTNQQLVIQDEILDTSNTQKRPWPTPSGGDYGLRKG